MKRIIFIVILLSLIFFFRDELNRYWIDFHAKKVDDPITWFQRDRDRLYNNLPHMDFTMYIESLKNFEYEISTAMSKLGGKDNMRGHRRDLICELAVVHKKMAMKYLQKSDTGLYGKHIRLSQEYLTECANLKSSF